MCHVNLIYWCHHLLVLVVLYITFFFFFNDTATTEIYTLSLHDALPICQGGSATTGVDRSAPTSKRSFWTWVSSAATSASRAPTTSAQPSWLLSSSTVA